MVQHANQFGFHWNSNAGFGVWNELFVGWWWCSLMVFKSLNMVSSLANAFFVV